MEVNPYESPRSEKPFSEGTLPGSDSIRQLLVEIRDAERETLQLQRDALLHLQKTRRFAYLPLIIILIPLAVSLYFSMTRIRAIPPTPPRPVPRALPAVPPQPIPKATLLDQRYLAPSLLLPVSHNSAD
jgi:hypothetical protein